MFHQIKSFVYYLLFLGLTLIFACSKDNGSLKHSADSKSNSSNDRVLSSENSNANSKNKSSKETILVNGKVYKVADIYNMKDEQLKQFMRDVIDDRLDPNYPVPDYIKYGTSTQAMYETFYTRYPHFAFQQDQALRLEVSFRPQMFVDMIRENKLLRNKATLLEERKKTAK